MSEIFVSSPPIFDWNLITVKIQIFEDSDINQGLFFFSDSYIPMNKHNIFYLSQVMYRFPKFTQKYMWKEKLKIEKKEFRTFFSLFRMQCMCSRMYACNKLVFQFGSALGPRLLDSFICTWNFNHSHQHYVSSSQWATSERKWIFLLFLSLLLLNFYHLLFLHTELTRWKIEIVLLIFFVTILLDLVIY